jgi:hypothetical protein
MTTNCKVIATCFAGKSLREKTEIVGNPPLMVDHSQNFPSKESVLDLVKLNVEQERTVDPGVPCDTIIINNDTGWEKGNKYLDSINNTAAHSGIIKVLHGANWGRSFGAYNEAYQNFKNEYEYWIFTEDDILVNGHNYYKIAIENFNKRENIGFVAIQGVSTHGLDGESGEHAKHAHGGCGITHVKILNELNKKLGKLPHCDKTESQSYEDCIIKGEIAFTNEIMKLGYELRTIENEYPLYWFAYDYMRGIRVNAKPTLLPLIKWWLKELVYHRLKNTVIYQQTVGKIKGK